MDGCGCGSGDVGQESSLRRDGFPLTGGEFTGRGRYLWGVRGTVRVRQCSLAVFVLPWRGFFSVAARHNDCDADGDQPEPKGWS